MRGVEREEEEGHTRTHTRLCRTCAQAWVMSCRVGRGLPCVQRGPAGVWRWRGGRALTLSSASCACSFSSNKRKKNSKRKRCEGDVGSLALRLNKPEWRRVQKQQRQKQQKKKQQEQRAYAGGCRTWPWVGDEASVRPLSSSLLLFLSSLPHTQRSDDEPLHPHPTHKLYQLPPRGRVNRMGAPVSAC